MRMKKPLGDVVPIKALQPLRNREIRQLIDILFRSLAVPDKLVATTGELSAAFSMRHVIMTPGWVVFINALAGTGLFCLYNSSLPPMVWQALGIFYALMIVGWAYVLYVKMAFVWFFTSASSSCLARAGWGFFGTSDSITGIPILDALLSPGHPVVNVTFIVAALFFAYFAQINYWKMKDEARRLAEEAAKKNDGSSWIPESWWPWKQASEDKESGFFDFMKNKDGKYPWEDLF
jgi:hypothetical protein